MFIRYTLEQQLIIPAQQYTVNTSKAVKKLIFQKYLYKITKYGLCVKIQSIQILDNIILRKTADMKVKLTISILVLNLLQNQYFQGTVSASDEDGIKISFLGGLLQGKLTIKDLHSDTLYSQQTKQWILTMNNSSEEGYKWKLGAKVRVRVRKAFWQNTEATQMHQIISLKADEPGLGPFDWWL